MDKHYKFHLIDLSALLIAGGYNLQTQDALNQALVELAGSLSNRLPEYDVELVDYGVYSMLKFSRKD
jgi:hypothetical protein